MDDSCSWVRNEGLPCDGDRVPQGDRSASRSAAPDDNNLLELDHHLNHDDHDDDHDPQAPTQPVVHLLVQRMAAGPWDFATTVAVGSMADQTR